MPKGYIVKLPMGMGKTRIVLAHILRGVGPKTHKWNDRLKRTVILAPNDRVKRAWLRELLLLALYRGLLNDTPESEIRDKGMKGLEGLLIRAGIAIPPFMTFHDMWNKKKPVAGALCHYLILDEWHRLPNKVLEACRDFVIKRKCTKWFIGGKNIKKRVYFVSATPVNPVLEMERENDINEKPIDEEVFQERVLAAVKNAADIVQAVLGSRGAKWKGKFLDVVRSLGVSEIASYGKSRLRWEIPREAKASGLFHFPEDSVRPYELSVIRDFLDKTQTNTVDAQGLIRTEYAFAVGLIRTRQDGKGGPHFICLTKKGGKRCFGEPYSILYYPPDLRKRRLKATTWLTEMHTRMKRLVNLLISEDIICMIERDELTLTKRKALIFCTHKGVALGLVRGLREILRHSHGRTDGSLPEIATNVHKSSAYIDDLITEFNKSHKKPFILVLTDALSESIDLHEQCKLVVHYELPWSPLRLFQRIGRLTRLMTRGDRLVFNRNVRVAHIVIPGSVEEERVNRLIRRTKFLSEQDLWPKGYSDRQLISGLIGSGPSLHYVEYKDRMY